MAASRTPSFHLVKLEDVEQFEELPVLLAVLELDVVLLQAVQGQLRLVVNVHLHRLDIEGAHSRHGPHNIIITVVASAPATETDKCFFIVGPELRS
jgi:hypothetical protein